MVLVASASALSVAANSVSADQISGQFQFTGKGVYTLIAKASATGLNTTFNNGGISPASDLSIPFTGTAGTISTRDNVIVQQMLAGGKNELKFRNTTGGAITVDFLLYYDAVK